MTIDARVEMYYGGQWHTITDDVDMREPITIDYGQPDEHGESNPTDLRLRLLNSDGTYSPQDPTSSLYGKIGIGTPVRVRIGSPDPTGLSLPGIEESYAATPDTAALDITGDLDVRADITPDSWRPGMDTHIVGKWQFQGVNDRSWTFRILVGGLLEFRWTPDGATQTTATSTVAVPDGSGRLAVRATLDVDNGAGGNTVRFYTAPSLAGPWTQLGADVVTAGTTSVFAGTAELAIGAVHNGVPFGGARTFSGDVAAVELRDGIGGTAVADVDFTSSADPDDRTVTDDTGLEWTLHNHATIIDPSLLASTEVTAWNPGWDDTTVDQVVDVQAAGVLERLGQGDDPLRSSLYRDLSTQPAVVAYYPLEEGSDSTEFRSGRANDNTSLAITGEVTLAAFSDLVSSEPIPTVADGYIRGAVPPYQGADDQRLMCLTKVPSAGVSGDRILMRAWTSTGNVRRWDIVVDSAGNLTVEGYDSAGALVFSDGPIAFDVNGKLLGLSLLLQQNGTATDWQVATFEPGAAVGDAFDASVTTTYGRITWIQLGSITGDGMNGTMFGHVAIFNDDVDSAWNVIGNSVIGWSGETALHRISRLATEEGIPLVIASDADDSEAVGAQGTDVLLSLLDDAAEVDLAFLGEQRDRRALRVRGHAALSNQDPRLTLDMADGRVVNPFSPPLDNQRVRNDITIERVRGGKHRAVQTTGPLNTSSPVDDPQGAGRHKSSQTLNLASDSQLRNQATWRLHLGTVNEHRVATLEIELEHHTDLIPSVLRMQQGDLVRITNPLPGLPPEDIDLLVLGWTHRITNQTWRARLNLSPGSPWRTAVTGSSRADTAGSELAQAATAADTTVWVHTWDGPTWTTDPTQAPLDLRAAGERWTAASIDAGIADAFSRTVAGGWGSAESGQNWTTNGGSASDFNVTSNRGEITLTTVSAARTALLGHTISDIDIEGTVATAVAATGDWITTGLVARYADASNYITAQVEFKHTGIVGIAIYLIRAGSPLGLGAEIGSYAAGEEFRVRLQVRGDSIRAKLWRAADREPAAWTVGDLGGADDLAAADVGVRAELSPGNTNTNPIVRWDDIDAPQLQQMTITRAVNGVSKAQVVGESVRLWQPAITRL